MIAQEALGHPVRGVVKGVLKSKERIAVLSRIFWMNQFEESMIQSESVKSITPGLNKQGLHSSLVRVQWNN